MTTPEQNQQPDLHKPYSDPTWALPSAYPPPAAEAWGSPPPPTGGYPPIDTGTSGYPPASYGPPAYPAGSYPQPGYGQAPYGPTGYPPPGYPLPRNGLGTASLVLGIIAVVLCWTVWAAAILGVLAICFGAVGLGKANRGEATNPGSAKAGLVLGIVAIALLVLLIIVGLSVFASGVSTNTFG